MEESYWSLFPLNKRRPWYERKCSSSWGCWLLGAPAYDADADTDGNHIADGGKDGGPV